MSAVLLTSIQVLAILLIGLVAGSMFGIWRGYDITAYTPATFVEVHQGAVRGLNILLPAMAAAALALVVWLAVLGRGRPVVLGLYLATALAILAGGIITRFLNQPINEQIMGWSPGAIPGDWTTLRDSWWHWHLARLGTTILADILLLAAVLTDRDG